MNGDIAVNYYGEMFSKSGYATAGRAYIHALHEAGVHVAVVGAGRPPASFEDELVRSMVGRHPNSDFTILHAIPTFWPRWAFALRNVVAVTVWEADPIPQTWQHILNRAIDVWVPCDFNVNVFAKALKKVPFCLPYALPDREVSHLNTAELRGVSPNDFVFYSIFDWQHRKNADGLVEAFFHAFPNDCDVVLLLKTIKRAAEDAQTMLLRVRSQTQSRARVLLFCETFDEVGINSLHERGDCYVSLHRGEGWGYPLFEAAARGKPAIVSAQGGPLDFLDPTRHRLIPCRQSLVREPYFLFTQEMQWAEPDLKAASEAMRWVFEHREAARADAAVAAADIRATYSLRQVGQMAKGRLIELLERRKVSP